jgi:hypothetical protein
MDGRIETPAETRGSWGNRRSPVVFNPYYEMLRLDSPAGGVCGLPGASHTLTYVLYHEARHAYQFSLTTLLNSGSSNDEDRDYLVNVVPILPNDIIVDSTVTRTVCDEFSNTTMQLAFKGPGNSDAYGDVRNHVPGVGYAIEMDAHKFASQQ